MSKLIISIASTVDGVIDGFEWYVSEGEHDQAGRDQFTGAGAMLLGRKTYEGLAGYWPSQEGPWADLLNPLPKVVASRTLSEPLEWNARLLEGELGEAVPRLKDELDGDLIVSGCGEFARNLLSEGLVDEVRFCGASGRLGRGCTPVPRREGSCSAPRVEGVRLGRHAPPLRAAGRRIARSGTRRPVVSTLSGTSGGALYRAAPPPSRPLRAVTTSPSREDGACAERRTRRSRARRPPGNSQRRPRRRSTGTRWSSRRLPWAPGSMRADPLRSSSRL